MLSLILRRWIFPIVRNINANCRQGPCGKFKGFGCMVLVGIMFLFSTFACYRLVNEDKLFYYVRPIFVRDTRAVDTQNYTVEEALQTANDYAERHRRIADVCASTDLSGGELVLFNKWHFQKQSVLYCGNLKVATTFMNGFLPHIFRCQNIESDCYTSPPKNSPVADITSLVDDSYSFTIVRDPYERLFSGYENKLFLPNEFWGTLGKEVVSKVRLNASWLSKMTGYDVTFLELVKYVIIKGHSDLNPHLLPMYRLCNPCQGRYNFVAKLESMSQDMDHLVSDLSENGYIHKNTSTTFAIESDVRQKQLVGPVHHLFTTLGDLKTYSNFSKSAKLNRQKLFQRTWGSYQIRGYILKDFPMPFKDDDKVTHDIYADAVSAAVAESAPYKAALKYQREEALLQAYRTVPLDIMLQLRKFVAMDCTLFGYDDKPDRFFKPKIIVNFDKYHNYFQGL